MWTKDGKGGIGSPKGFVALGFEPLVKMEEGGTGVLRSADLHISL
jgi:hypothetical protein